MAFVSHYFLFDLESSGLNKDPFRNPDCILEVAFVVIDAKTLETVGEGQQVVVPPGIKTLHMFEDWRRALRVRNPFVHDMHSKNGLLDFIAAHIDMNRERPDVLSTHELVQSLLVKEIDKYLVRVPDTGVHPGNSSIVLAGNSLTNLDVPLLGIWMPRVLPLLSYRIMDVSVIREFYTDLSGVKLPAGLDEAIRSGTTDPNATHRALDDVKHCADALRRLKKYAKDVESLAANASLGV